MKNFLTSVAFLFCTVGSTSSRENEVGTDECLIVVPENPCSGDYQQMSSLSGRLELLQKRVALLHLDDGYQQVAFELKLNLLKLHEEYIRLGECVKFDLASAGSIKEDLESIGRLLKNLEDLCSNGTIEAKSLAENSFYMCTTERQEENISGRKAIFTE